MSWASRELDHANLGDVRRNRRLVKIVEDLAASPESSVPLASRDRAALQGMYDFWANPRIKAASISESHVWSAVNRSACWGWVLAIQDTTELDYSAHRHKQGLGYLRGADTKGVLLHSVLSVSPEGTPLGILHQRLWARSGRKTLQQRRSSAQKESVRWSESLQATEDLLPTTRIVTIADREADIYELLAYPRLETSDYLIRIHHDRQVKLTPKSAAVSLHQMMRSAPARGYFQLQLQRTPRRAGREAIVSVCWESVWLQPPTHLTDPQLEPMQVQVLWAIEEECALEDQPVNWMLVTSLPIGCFEQAQCLLRWYSYRWLIERYHYTLKSGCRVESLQLETFDRIERAIATFAIVAWRLMWLTYLVRPLDNPRFDLEAHWELEPEEWQALCHYYDAPPDWFEDPGLQQCIRWIAQLGGFWGRKSDGEPGARTIWRGLRRLRDLVRQTSPPDAIAAPACV
ncbi:IS4 family transposase [Microcoleus sp. FACHB-1515]|uniref:IS4 family transposase n=1 Tax=Cyanophyceae TaxID=3028117 RepID=UPI001684F537|nr:IS4 family transposase [Microcoleus sp. FACHB-1515]MBD2092363.1 IS4 family transposase [Microcoleus sp. FACHB-1515]